MPKTLANTKGTGGSSSSPAGLCPVGSVLHWDKSFAGTPALTGEWVECNGQVISDASSPYNGKTMRSLNSTNRFIRGNTTSGGVGGNSSVSLSTSFTPSLSVCSDTALSGSSSPCFVTSVAGNTSTITMPTFNPSPLYMDMVYIYRIK